MMNKTHYLFLFLFIFPLLGKAQNWQALGPDDFNQASFGDSKYPAISTSTGVPYLAFVYDNKKIKVRKFVANKWETVSDGVFSGDNSSQVKIVFDGTTPYVAYREGNSDGKLTVKKQVGTDWQLVGTAGISDKNIQKIDFVIDAGIPYVAYTDGVNQRKLMVKKFNGTSWVSVGSGDVSDIYAGYPSLTFDENHNPHVVYINGNDNGKMIIKKYDSTSNNWLLISDINLKNIESPRIIFNGGFLYAMCYGWSNGNKLTVSKLNGTAWEKVATDVSSGYFVGADINFNGTVPFVMYKVNDEVSVKKLNATASDWESVAQLPASDGGEGGSMDPDPMMITFLNTIPHVIYLKNGSEGKAIVKKFDQSKWEDVGDTGIAGSSVNYISLALDGTSPYIAYNDGTNEGKLTVKKHDGTNWGTVGTPGFSLGRVNNLTIAFDGTTPYVAYKDNSVNFDLFVDRYTGTSWERLTTAAVSNGGSKDSHMAINNSTVYVAYNDSGNQGKIIVKKFNVNTNAWEQLGGFLSVNNSGNPKIAFNDNVPYVVYRDNYSKLFVKKFSSNTWETVGNVDLKATPSGLVFNKGKAYIVYTDGYNDSKVTVRSYDSTTLKWELVGTPFAEQSMSNAKLIFVNDVLHVAYSKYLGGSASVRKYNGNDWEIVGNSDFSAEPANPIEITSNGKELVVAYKAGDVYAKSFALPTPTVLSNSTVYVTEEGAGSKDGSSWSNATADLQKAMQNSTANVYVAAGTYKPIYPAQTDFSTAYSPNRGNRNNAFLLVKDVKVYGGFNATNPEASPELRDTSATSANKTILSGDYLGNDPNDFDGDDFTPYNDNGYHVVVSAGDVGTAVLNGFTIKDGIAYDEGILEEDGNTAFEANITVNEVAVKIYMGGGIATAASSPKLTNLHLQKNLALGGGAIAATEGGAPMLSNINITENLGFFGGGVLNFGSNSTFTNVLIAGNFGQLGGMFNASSSPVLTNVTLSGGIANQESSSRPIIRNSIIDGILNDNSTPVISYSLISGSGGSGANWEATTGTDGGNNIDGDALFMDPSTGDYRLKAGSPAINAGSNAFYASGETPDLSAITIDLAGNLRMNGTVDMGAYEYEGTLPITLVNFSAKAETNGARLTWQTANEENSSSFIINRSTDGVNFTVIGTVNSKGNSSNLNHYSFLDLSPANGTNYYGLQQIDADGKINDLGVRSVDFKLATDGISVYPNPTADVANIKFNSGHFSNVTLTDLAGKVLAQQLISSEQTETQLDLSTYKTGTYVIRLKGAKESKSFKVVKF